MIQNCFQYSKISEYIFSKRSSEQKTLFYMKNFNIFGRIALQRHLAVPLWSYEKRKKKSYSRTYKHKFSCQLGEKYTFMKLWKAKNYFPYSKTSKYKFWWRLVEKYIKIKSHTFPQYYLHVEISLRRSIV